ncbi:MAG: hypothetical protein ACHP84_02750 [Caulobacterales bacterium]
MNALTPKQARLPNPTAEEPIPTLVGALGLTLLRSATADRLHETLGPAERLSVQEICPAIIATTSPATAAEIGLAFEALALHFPGIRRTDREHRIVLNDWLEDLQDWPADLIQECARLWRNGDSIWFPTAGQFKKLMEAALVHRQRLARRAARFLEIAARENSSSRTSATA